MPKFQLKSEPVEAIEWTGKNFKEVDKLFPSPLRLKNDRLYVVASNLNEVHVGDYLFANGLLCRADNLKTNYEEVK